MQFTSDTPLYSYEVRREGGEDVLYLNYLGAPFVPSVAASPDVMERVVDSLLQNPQVSRVVLVQQKNYNYDFTETSYLLELAQLYVHWVRQERVLSQERLVVTCPQYFAQRYNDLFGVLSLLKKDPLLAHHELHRLLVEGKVLHERMDASCKGDQAQYLSLLQKMFSLLDSSRLVRFLKPFLGSYKAGERELYERAFRPDTIPNFTFTRLMNDLPRDAEMVDQYTIARESYDSSVVTILREPDEAKLLYHVVPPEHTLKEEHHVLLNLARRVLIEHQPKAEEFTDTERTRQVFFHIAKDLLQDLARTQSMTLSFAELNKLATILVRHTIGFGILEVLLQDSRLQDISLNAPIARTPIFVRHQEFDECVTNILPSQEDVDSWAAKFRMISGRPLDEANPILDTQLELENLRARIAIIQEPLSPDGLSYSLRRHRDSPWTLPLFIRHKMLNPLAAGVLSFLVDGARTMLLAGTRSSGKTSLLGSLMLEIMPRHRIIMIEDSLELPFESLRKLKYDILRMKVRSSLLKSGTEVGADEGIRTSLRLGDSCLIVGEVRSVEAKALYEAMRVGALANVVAGTIHGASPYGVFDRVVNDLGVPATSFKATDVIAVANPVKSADGLRSSRRLMQISEVRKHWKRDPMEEKGFVDLLRYNVERDQLEASDDLVNGDSEVIKAIASQVKGWAGNWDAVYDNISLRAKIKEALVAASEKTKNAEILEAGFTVRSNDAFHKISARVREEIGLPLSERVFPEWQKWLNTKIKGKKV